MLPYGWVWFSLVNLGQNSAILFIPKGKSTSLDLGLKKMGGGDFSGGLAMGQEKRIYITQHGFSFQISQIPFVFNLTDFPTKPFHLHSLYFSIFPGNCFLYPFYIQNNLAPVIWHPHCFMQSRVAQSCNRSWEMQHEVTLSLWKHHSVLIQT